MKVIFFLCIVFVSSVFATYYDSDIDGVEDSIDRCADTPFDKLVDEFGCSTNKNLEKFIVKLGVDTNFDTTDDTVNTYNFLLQYEKENWIAGISNSQYIGYDENDIGFQKTGDIYAYLGYSIQDENFVTTVGAGMKIAVADTLLGTGENDYYLNTQISSPLFKNSYRVFSTFAYTVTGDTKDIKYKDIFSYSMGLEYAVNDKYTTALYYENSESIYEDTQNYKAVVWSNHYTYNEKYFIELDYIHGLDIFSYDHQLSFRIGAVFE